MSPSDGQSHRFPTLANELETAAPTRGSGAFELVAVFTRDAARSDEPQLSTRGATRLAEDECSVSGVVDMLRSGGDLLIVSRPERVAPALLDDLRRALVVDSACTSVSADGGALPESPGVPAPAIERPRPGVVLLRGEDVALAADESRWVAGIDDVPTGAGVAQRLLELVDRPGFVHRALGERRPPAALRPSAARPASDRPPAVLDGSCLAHPFGGTQAHAVGLIRGLASVEASFAVIEPPSIHPTVAAELERVPAVVPFVSRRDVGRASVFHRPFQLWSLHELADRLSLGERFVLTHQDMMWNRNPSYHVGDGWLDYHRATIAALASSDAIGFFSRHAALDAASEGAFELDRATVVPLGVDHFAENDASPLERHPLAGRPYLLMLGSSFWHKNRLLGLRILQRLVERHGWDGGLVLVGGDAGPSSSTKAEAALLARHPELEGRVRDLGHVAPDEKSAILRQAELVLYPSLNEGFGFIPFEAAAMGVACLYSSRGAMLELLPTTGAFPSLEIDAATAFVLGALETPSVRSRIVDDVSAVAKHLTWERTAAGYLEIYARAVERPARGMSRELLSLVVADDRRLTSQAEIGLLDAYRRRPGFRRVLDATLRVGRTGAGLARRRPRARSVDAAAK